MRILKNLLTLAGLVGFGGLITQPTDAEAQTRVISEEEACERALRAGTIEALEDFLRKYRRGNSACYALAYEALSDFSPDGGRSDPSSVNDGRYGG